ncbi:hypothetical protein [Roseobacter sinensis]|uniref:Uncharacterized protein n=1 Tax=Roseobacter sinensis TaxID=2931391 RepID=A0ABT3BGB7_9RHOB|nr:hypothetical protein [Roseobacter sp. WL0113]MCV3272585.1 hypothetical protein [Roseobacter sp. WL0113]
MTYANSLFQRLCLIAAAAAASAWVQAPDAAAQTAQGVLYDCDMSPSRRNEFWISTKIGFVLLDTGAVVISDGVTLAYGVGTAPGTLLRNTDREIRVSWQLEGGLRQRRDREVIFPNAEYTATISKPSNRITVRGKLPGHRSSFSGRGQCVMRAG